jgi:spore coat polysaccharide biosynthesis predicted glycosyltransferase SpsG
MFQADFAVSTSSSTTYELLALGTPIISVPVADNQKPIARSLRERGAAKVLEKGSEQSSFRRSVEMYLADESLRKEHKKIGRQLVDEKGTKRVANEVSKLSHQ